MTLIYNDMAELSRQRERARGFPSLMDASGGKLKTGETAETDTDVRTKRGLGAYRVDELCLCMGYGWGAE